MKVNVEYIEELLRQLREVDSVPFDEIEWYKNGELLVIDKKILDDWKFTGLNNRNFPEYGLEWL